MPKVRETVAGAKPVVEKLAKDEKLRKTLIEAVTTARSVYDEVGDERNVKALATKIASDKKLQKDLQKTVRDLQKATKRATKKSHKKRNALILAGIVIGLLYNPVTGPDTRRKIRDKVVGEDETFEYEGLSTN
jgi:gas vesicle protein